MLNLMSKVVENHLNLLFISNNFLNTDILW